MPPTLSVLRSIARVDGLFVVLRPTGRRSTKKASGAHVAQLAEHVLGKDEVIGSIPIMGSIDLTNSLTETKH